MMRTNNPEYAALRRTFLKGSLAAGAAVAGSAMLGAPKGLAQTSESLTKGDVAILRLLAAAELIAKSLPACAAKSRWRRLTIHYQQHGG
jgi:hypothetical protein